MASDGPRMLVTPRGDGGITLRLGSLVLELEPAGAGQLHEEIGRALMPGQPATCAYCEDDPDHPDPDNAGTCTCHAPGCGRGWCPKRDAAAELGQPADVQPPAPLAYDPAIDNCANMPGCGDQRVLFTWYGPAICCPRCYVNLFGGEPDPAFVITIPAVPGQPGAAGEAGAGRG